MSDTDPGPKIRAATGGTVRTTVPEAARHLGISERSVRKRLVAGTLAGVKEGKSWIVLLYATPDAALTDSTADSSVLADPNAALPRGPGTALESAAIAVLERLLREERRTADENRDAALHWQFRALRAEETVAALQAGPIAQEAGDRIHDHAPVSEKQALLRDDGPSMASDTLHEASAAPDLASERLALGWRRWWRRMIGG